MKRGIPHVTSRIQDPESGIPYGECRIVDTSSIPVVHITFLEPNMCVRHGRSNVPHSGSRMRNVICSMCSSNTSPACHMGNAASWMLSSGCRILNAVCCTLCSGFRMWMCFSECHTLAVESCMPCSAFHFLPLALWMPFPVCL